jgi:hypothetical protein
MKLEDKIAIETGQDDGLAGDRTYSWWNSHGLNDIQNKALLSNSFCCLGSGQYAKQH